MQNEKKTRFEVGMEAIYIADTNVFKGEITNVFTSIFTTLSSVEFTYTHKDKAVTTLHFNSDGRSSECRSMPSLFTLPEYEALQALTASFIDGTFGAKKEQPKFEPKINEPIIYNGKEYVIKDSVTWHTLQFVNGVSSVKGCHVKPVEGYEYSNGFCEPLPKPKADVITLPSWFKGGAVLDTDSIRDFVNNQGVEVLNKVNEFLYSYCSIIPECTFYSCNIKTIGSCNPFNAFIADYVLNDVYYTMIIDTANPDSANTELLAAYNKNGKDVNEKII